jgi:hypothetical protein
LDGHFIHACTFISNAWLVTLLELVGSFAVLIGVPAP